MMKLEARQVVPPEKDDGPTEYKRQVINPTAERVVKLTTQMSYRLDQGNGVCTYMIGVEDDGKHSMLDHDTVRKSAENLEAIARNLNAVRLRRRFVQGEVVSSSSSKDADGGEEKKSAEGCVVYDDACTTEPSVPTRCELVVQRIETHLIDARMPTSTTTTTPADAAASSITSPGTDPNGPPSIEETLSSRNIRVAVVGNVDAGKSTMIGTLTTSSLDDGRGKSRTAIMKHRHEIESGRTSTATTHILGFKATGDTIVGRDRIRANRLRSEDEIVRESHRIITLMDLAGHEKYLKTTIHGVASGFADHALILVNSRHPPTHMTHHHLNLCCSYGIPVIIVFTKIDGCPEHARQQSRQEVVRMLRAPDIGKRPFAVREEKDIANCMVNLHAQAPMVDISCVDGEGMDLLRKLLFALPKRRKHENRVSQPFEFLVEDIFNVPGVGAVVSGFVFAGELDVGGEARVYVGPTDDGSFLKTVAKSAQIARINTRHVTSGQSACLALALSKDLRKKLRRGMVVLKDSPKSTRQFDAEICVLKGEGTTIRRSYQAFVHILNVRQSAYARSIEVINHAAHGLQAGEERGVGGDDDDENAAAKSVVLRPGCRAKVRFEFAKRPEYIRPGMKMLFRDGRVRGVGKVTGIPSVITSTV